jgi:hypothetical protein
MRDEQFGIRPRYSASLQLDRLVERTTRKFDKTANRRRLLDVAKASIPSGSMASSTR